MPGFLSSADFTTFSAKQAALTFGNLTEVTSSVLTIVGGTGAVIGAGVTLTVRDAVADGATKGVATFTASDFNSLLGVISLDYVNGQKASASVPGFLSSADWTAFNALVAGSVPSTRRIDTTGPLAGGGDLSADRTLSIANAKADGATLGAAAFTAADFNDNGAGVISLDYTNGQKATASVPGFLSAADFVTFSAAATGEVVISTNTTYFVRTDGSDANSGTANTAGGAWLTLQHAVDVVCNFVVLKGITLTVQVGNGTYTLTSNVILPNFEGGGSINIKGDETTLTNVVVTTSTAIGQLFYGQSSASWTLSGMQLGATGGTPFGIVVERGILYFKALRFSTGLSIHLRSAYGGVLYCVGAYTIAGASSVSHTQTTIGGVMVIFSVVVTITGTPAFPNFTLANAGGIQAWNGTTFSGAATGTRFNGSTLACIDTGSGASATFFPGNVAGGVVTGAVYN